MDDPLDKNKERNLFDVPVLKQVFNKILSHKKPHCVLCLRTNNEVRLVRPNHFKKYLQMTKMYEHGNLQESLICYICEQKSKNALIFYRSAMFSATLKSILRELIQTNVINEYEIFEKNYFKKLLTSIGLSENLSPADIENELEYTRKTCWLSETDIDIIDSTQPTIVANTMGGMNRQVNVTDENKFAIVQYANILLATPPVLTNQVVASTSNQALNKATEECIVLDDDDEEEEKINTLSPGLSPNPYLQTKQPNLKADVATSPLKMKPPADVQFTNKNYHYILSLSAEVEKEIYTDDATKTFVKNDSAVNGDSRNLPKKRKKPNQKQSKPKSNPKSTIRTKRTQLKIRNVRKGNQNQKNTNTNLCDLPQTNYILVTDTIPSTNALIVNNNVVTQNNMAAISIQDITQNNLFFVYSDSCQTNARIVNANDNCQGTLVLEKPDTNVKMDGSILKGALCNNMSINPKITGVVISDISSDMDAPGTSQETRGTDWEDKIPMDVISFMDAVDPNASPAWTHHRVSSPASAIKISKPVSLANTKIKLDDNIHLRVDTEIIDLR